MFFQIVFVSLILVVLGLLLCFVGFRFFVVLLPLFGFFAGFLITAEAIQELFGGGFLATASSWVFGFVIGIFCAAIAYLYYYVAVAILAASAGYELGIGVISGLGVNSGFLQFIIGLVLAVIFVAAVIVLNLPKVLIVALTAAVGASMILAGILLALGRIALTDLNLGVVGAFIHASWFWFLVYLVIGGAGIAVQLFLTETYIAAPSGQQRPSRTVPPAEQPVPSSPPTGTAPTTP